MLNIPSFLITHIHMYLKVVGDVIVTGQLQKISIPYHGRLPYFNSPCLRNFQNALSPCPRISKIVNPPPVRIFHFFLSNPSELPAGFANMPNLAYFTENYLKGFYFCSVQLVIEGVIMTLEILEGKFYKN